MPTPSAAETAASWLHQGQVTESSGAPDALPQALEKYEQALAVATADPAAVPSRLRGLIRMNRANALVRLRRPADAVADYDAALAEFGPLDPVSPPEHRSSIGAAWLNRAGALRSSQPEQVEGMLQSLENAIVALRTLPIDAHAVYRRNLAAALLHQGDVLLRIKPPQTERAATLAEEALALAAPIEDADPASADVGLKARLVLLGAWGPRARAAEATDVAEAGIALARRWVGRGIVGFALPAGRLTEIAATLYQLHQPHFLAEFWREQLTPPAPPPAWAAEDQLRKAALHTLRPAWHALQERRLREPDSDKSEQVNEALQEVEQLIRELEAAAAGATTA